jgi:hypothetical protein
MNMNNSNRVLRENLSFQQANLVVESTDDTTGKSMFMHGIFVQGGVKNLNDRVYPVTEIRSAVDSINSQIKEGYSICGEADHPEELNINLDRVSHIITQMWMDGPNGMGKLKILPTPMGNIVRTLLDSGVKLGVSSRGSGNVTNNGEVSDFQIVTVDIVMRPSAPAAYPEYVYEARNSRRGTVIDNLSKEMMNDDRAKHFLKAELMSWISNLK